ncbi:hypothetical protein SUGI_0583560 [Cryptomeria japonica]|uniref:ethylene-responsive transcription factor 1A-like n=1 Tax=Cryptomeria japonica TaxID=3369 RepID=UPI00241481F3|nr:ethylene-responsive transcription factor 1A-like [Cryptomeria japonica]XP_057861477.1 ethylene-responsive transcription factor 1A-like [Cryptomeria japonica]GLJ29587.1 hypothetical protein SUGI_0583520 [Cryptomeria japonica]GLJ29591.1 hypothetical protein SUGI_0583560 [Cryptomeria japonica]
MDTPVDEEKRMLNAIGQYLLGEEYIPNSSSTAAAEEQQNYEESEASMAVEGAENKNKEGEKHYRGVRFVKARGKYAAEIRNPDKKGSRLWLGSYETAEAAAAAYDRKAFEIRGSRATLNFPLNVESGQYVDPFSQPSSSHTPSNIPKKRKTQGKDEGQSPKELGSD